MQTKIKINLSVDIGVHKTFVQLCKAMGVPVSTFVNELMKSFIESERRPKESNEDLIERIEHEFSRRIKRDKLITFKL